VTLAFGDLQGCRQPLEQLLKKIGAAPTEPLWFCGDLVNRGPDSLGTLRQIRQLGLRARTVLGNHDLHLLAQYAGIRTPRPGDTLDPILRAPDAPELIDWLRTRPLALRQGDFLMVHAGLLPEWEFEQARDLAHEVEKVLSGPHWQDFLSVMYGNTPDRWSARLRGDRGMTLVLVTHDLALARQFGDDVIVMEKGKLVEANTTDELFNNPVEDYTRELIEAVPGRNIQLNL